MARTNNLTNFLTDVADSIREKTGKSGPIACEDFDTEIESISGGGDTPRLPVEYQEVAYIESNGTQRIDTGIAPNDDNYGIKTKFSITEATGDWNLINMGGSTVDRNRFGFGGYFPSTGTNEWQISYIRGMSGNICFVKVNTLQMLTNTDYKVEYNYNGNKIFKLNGLVLYSNIPTGTNKITYTNNWNIFCQAYSSNSFDRFFTGKLYYMKIYLGENLLRDYVPCYRKSDNEVGLYDLVNNVFYTNAGTGTFSKGGNVYPTNLQDKLITITSNTTTLIEPDSGIVGLSSVSVTTNVPSQPPTVGTIFSDWDNDGYPHTAQYGGRSSTDAYYFGTQTTSGGYGLTCRLETVTLSNDVTQLGNYTFTLCKQLTSVIAPSVTVVGNGAFNGNIALQSFPTFSSSSVSLGNNVFQDCTAFNPSTIPSNVTSIGAACFQGCTGLHLTEIPTTVSSVGNNAFSGCTGIQQITLHNTTTFGTSVFYNCTGLTTVNLDGETFNFPSNFFQNCSNLQTIDTTKLVVVPQYGFSGCTNLSVTQFHNTTDFSVYGARIFQNCKKIYQLSFPILKGIVPNAQQYATFSGCNIRAIWLGSAITTNGLNQHSFRQASELRRIFFDLPRATVEAMPQYANKFSGNTVHSTCEIICNDDSGWLTLAQFDAIDWETYTP